MLQSSDSEFSSFPKFRLIEEAMSSLKKSVSAHLECETRLERLYLGWQQKWLSQFNQLRMQIETLEARISPWMSDPADGPRLAVVSHHEDVA